MASAGGGGEELVINMVAGALGSFRGYDNWGTVAGSILSPGLPADWDLLSLGEFLADDQFLIDFTIDPSRETPFPAGYISSIRITGPSVDQTFHYADKSTEGTFDNEYWLGWSGVNVGIATGQTYQVTITFA